jgi:Ras-related C3 botulinum toxin substrate 1
MALQNFKLVVVGDGAVGKTCLVTSYSENRFLTDYIPNQCDNFTAPVEVDNQSINLNVWDTAGQEEYARLRALCYPDTDCFLVCFSVVCESSFDNVLSKWLPEIRQTCPKSNIQLVGTKNDLRDNQEILDLVNNGEIKIITQEQAEDMAKRIGATKYIECSSLTQFGLQAVFEDAIRGVLGCQIDKEGDRIYPTVRIAMKNAASARVSETPE